MDSTYVVRCVMSEEQPLLAWFSWALKRKVRVEARGDEISVSNAKSASGYSRASKA